MGALHVTVEHRVTDILAGNAVRLWHCW